MVLMLKLAWRNIWRNKKRTFLTMSSIVLAIVLSIMTKSMQSGTFGNMINNAVKLSTGYLQIQNKDYWENKSINETFIFTSQIDSLLSAEENIDIFIPRLESFALASSGKQTKGVFVKGTHPELEEELNNYSTKLVSGEYLSGNDRAVLIGSGLAKFLSLDVGDSIIMLGQGFRGITAAAQYPVKGIFDFPIPQMNDELIILPLKATQYFYACADRLTSVSVMLKDPEKLEETASNIEESLKKNLTIITWMDMNNELVQFVDTKLIGGTIMLAILYIVVGFGVFGTIMMMTMERRKEFAIMISIGIKRIKLLAMVFSETLFIGFVAVSIGLIIIYPVVAFLTNNPIQLQGGLAESMKSVGAEPILPFVNKAEIFIIQTFSVIIISIFAIIYPFLFIIKFNIQKAMRD